MYKKSLLFILSLMLLAACTQDLPPEPGAPGAGSALGQAIGLFSGYAEPTKLFVNPGILIFDLEETEKGVSVSVTGDQYVYRYGYILNMYSNTWNQFTFVQTPVANSNWIKGDANINLPVNIYDLDIMGQTSSRDVYVIAYACTKMTIGWDCHKDQWMLSGFTASYEGLPPEPGAPEPMSTKGDLAAESIVVNNVEGAAFLEQYVAATVRNVGTEASTPILVSLNLNPAQPYRMWTENGMLFHTRHYTDSISVTDSQYVRSLAPGESYMFGRFMIDPISDVTITANLTINAKDNDTSNNFLSVDLPLTKSVSITSCIGYTDAATGESGITQTFDTGSGTESTTVPNKCYDNYLQSWRCVENDLVNQDWTYCENGCANGKCLSTKATCSDFDNSPNYALATGPDQLEAMKGNDIYVNGQIVALGEVQTTYDSCHILANGKDSYVYSCNEVDNPGCLLLEGYCNPGNTLAGTDGIDIKCPNGCQGGACLTDQAALCKDSDKSKDYSGMSTDVPGDDIFTKGTATSTISFGEPGNYESTDQCIISENVVSSCTSSDSGCGVREYFCSRINAPGSIEQAALPCPNGCSDGACLNQATQTTTSPTQEPYILQQVHEIVTCRFRSTIPTTQECFSDDHRFGCSGATACDAEVLGTKGTHITWKSSCSGLAYTTIDETPEFADFNC